MVLLVVTPVSVFGMLVSAQALIVTMFGGIGTVWGPVIGAAILIPVAETLHAELGVVLPGIQGVIFGARDHRGDPGRARRRVLERARLRCAVARQGGRGAAADVPSDHVVRLTTPERSAAQRAAATHAEVILEVRNLSKSFGGLQGGPGRQLRRSARA